MPYRYHYKAKSYYLLIIKFENRDKFFKFNESSKAKALSLKRRYELQGIETVLKHIVPAPSKYVQMSMFKD